ncbi:unnamed protein product [Plutella xylostella]|uniref:(diamondback moth) hypothetical protein n=1 Tax=Plutella xylostella TaxID=51655 RepID=A0A8S4G2T5_PLUXY|nr:unnamed protein product [Plutella xylostella]
MVHKIISKITSNTDTGKEKEDVLAKLVGHIGKWQLIVFTSIFLVKFSSGTVQMAIIFLTPKASFWCSKFDSNSTSTVVNNTCYSGCVEYEYDTSPMETSIVSEWDLVCERQWLASFTQTVLQFGILIGSIMFGFLSDRYGRRSSFLASITLLIIFGFAIPFSPSYTIFTLLRFMMGIATAGTMVVSFVIVMETVGPKYREVLGCVFQIPFIVGHMSVPLFAYYFRTWDSYSLALAVPPVIYLGYFFLLSESPRWLVSVGRVEEATRIVTDAALLNNLPTANIEATLTKLSKEILNNKTDEPKLNYIDLFRTSSLRKRTVCSCALWLIGGLTFFGVNQYITQTSPDPFVSAAAAGAIQPAIEDTLTKLSKEILNNKTDEPKLDYIDLFRTASLRKRTVCSCALWLIGGLTFFGVNQYITQTSPDPFVSAAAAGAIQPAIEDTLTKLSKEILNNKTDEPKLNYIDLFRTAGLRKRTMCSCALWLIGGLTFFGVNQYITQTSPDPFVSAAAAGAIQIPSNLFAIWMVRTFNRKTSTAIFFALGGIFIIILGCVPKIFWLTLTLGSLGSACGAIFNTAIYIFTSELFPTVARNMGMGVCSMSMRIGSMIAPFVANVSYSLPWMPTVIFGLAPLVAAAICMLLPETKNRKLPDSVDDVENFV